MRLVYNEELETPSPITERGFLQCLTQCPPSPSRFSLSNLLPSRLVPLFRISFHYVQLFHILLQPQKKKNYNKKEKLNIFRFCLLAFSSLKIILSLLSSSLFSVWWHQLIFVLEYNFFKPILFLPTFGLLLKCFLHPIFFPDKDWN